MKCLYLAVRSLDPTGRGQQRWSNRWKPALNAFAITFEGRIEINVNNHARRSYTVLQTDPGCDLGGAGQFAAGECRLELLDEA